MIATLERYSPGLRSLITYAPVPIGVCTNSIGVSDGTSVTVESSNGRIAVADPVAPATKLHGKHVALRPAVIDY